MGTPQAAAMAEIVQSVAPTLRTAGFKKRRHVFNRTTSDGLIHVVRFWMAPFEPPAWTEVPGLRERRYGGFRLDLGVWVPEMKRTHTPRSGWINDYDCQLRVPIARLWGDKGDFWWNVQEMGVAAKAEAALVNLGFAWLDRFASRRLVLEEFDLYGSLEIGMSPAGALDIAELHLSLGDQDTARETLERYLSSPVLVTHAKYLAEYLQQFGHDDLVERIQIRPPN